MFGFDYLLRHFIADQGVGSALSRTEFITVFHHCHKVFWGMVFGFFEEGSLMFGFFSFHWEIRYLSVTLCDLNRVIYWKELFEEQRGRGEEERARSRRVVRRFPRRRAAVQERAAGGRGRHGLGERPGKSVPALSGQSARGQKSWPCGYQRQKSWPCGYQGQKSWPCRYQRQDNEGKTVIQGEGSSSSEILS